MIKISLKNFLKKKILFANIAVFLVLFSVSTSIRMVNMEAPLGRGHEWITGHVLLTLCNYQNGGPGHYHFSPVWTVDKPAEKFLISNQKFKDKNDYAYYVSYPPLCFLAPYYFFKILHIAPGVASIRGFGIFLHFICAFVMLLIVYEFFNKKLSENFFLPAFLASALYLFAAGNLWFHANIYFADTLVQVFILLSLLLLVKLFKDPSVLTKTSFLVSLGLINFFGVYTEWLQVFLAFVTCIIAFFLIFKDRKFWRLLILMSSTTILSISLAIYQFSTIAGFENLKEKSVEKYKQRSGRTELSEQGANVDSYNAIANLTGNYERHYSDVLNLVYFSILVLLLILILNRNFKTMFKDHLHIILPVLIISLALFMHIYIFFNFNIIHDFSTLKTSTLFCLLTGISFAALISYTKPYDLAYRYGAILIFLGIFGYNLSNSVNAYYRNNNSNQVTYYHANIGQAARAFAKPDEIVFARTINPVTSYYAHRNIVNMNSVKEALAFLQFAKYDKGIFIDCDNTETGLIKRVVRLNGKGDSTLLAKDYLPRVYTEP